MVRDAAILGGIALGAAVVLIAAPEQLSSWPSLCLTRQLTGWSCPGCGMLRAFSSLAHGDFSRALEYNRMVVVVAPLVAYLALRRVASAVERFAFGD